MNSNNYNRKLIVFAGAALALLALAPSASAAAVVIPNGAGCVLANDTFAPAGFGGSACVYATGACFLTVVVTDGTNVYTYSKTLHPFVTPTWVVLVHFPAGYTAGASCPPIA